MQGSCDEGTLCLVFKNEILFYPGVCCTDTVFKEFVRQNRYSESKILCRRAPLSPSHVLMISALDLLGCIVP